MQVIEAYELILFPHKRYGLSVKPVTGFDPVGRVSGSIVFFRVACPVFLSVGE
jgi:hypothetical protein